MYDICVCLNLIILLSEILFVKKNDNLYKL